MRSFLLFSSKNYISFVEYSATEEKQTLIKWRSEDGETDLNYIYSCIANELNITEDAKKTA